MTGAYVVDVIEAGAAREYFGQLCPDMMRREESPMNSRLNYGYSVIRNSIIRAIVASGLLPSFGIHHQNLYNAYNLADDLIEPFRPCVDIVAFEMKGIDLQLTKKERKQLASVLQNAVITGGQKMSVLQAIDKVVGEYRSYVMEECDVINLPSVLPIEILRHVIE